jgi:hypothetical protein
MNFRIEKKNPKIKGTKIEQKLKLSDLSIDLCTFSTIKMGKKITDYY